MLMSLLLAVLLQDPVEVPPDEATAEGLRELLNTVWRSPPERIKKLGGSVLTRSRRKNARGVELQYAYGLVLARHQDWPAAANNFEDVVKKVPNQPDALLALVHVHSRLGQLSRALEELQRAFKAQPQNPEIVRTLAVYLTFLNTNPPPKFTKKDANEIEDGLFPQLPPDLQDIYREGREWTQAYIDDLPNLRAELMEPVDQLRKEALAARESAGEKDREFQSARAEYNRQRALLDQVVASSNARLAQLDTQIQRALQRGDSVSASLYQNERIALVDQTDARVRASQIALRELEVALQQIDQELRYLVSQADGLEGQALTAEDDIDRELQWPPSEWDPLAERDRLLAVGQLDRPEMPAKPPKPPQPKGDPESRARSLLAMADALRQSNKPDLALKYLQRLVAEFPQTAAGKDAAWELEQVQKEVDAANKASAKKADDKPNPKKRRKTKPETP